MSQIVLHNNTGKQSGSYIHYDYGCDLFGYLYLDVSKQKKHTGKIIKKMHFENPKDFICTLDIDIYNKECRHYERTTQEPLFSGNPFD